MTERETKKWNKDLKNHCASFLLHPFVLIDAKTKAFLATEGVACQSQDIVTLVKDTQFNRVIKRIDSKTSRIDLDESNRLVTYINLYDMGTVGRSKIQQTTANVENADWTIQSAADLQPIIKRLESFLELDGYVLINCEKDTQHSWFLLWKKEMNNGIINPYDAVSATIDGKDDSVTMIFRNMQETGDVEPLVTEKQAIQFALPVLQELEYSNISATLSYVKPNFFGRVSNPVKAMKKLTAYVWHGI